MPASLFARHDSRATARVPSRTTSSISGYGCILRHCKVLLSGGSSGCASPVERREGEGVSVGAGARVWRGDRESERELRRGEAAARFPMAGDATSFMSLREIPILPEPNHQIANHCICKNVGRHRFIYKTSNGSCPPTPRSFVPYSQIKWIQLPICSGEYESFILLSFLESELHFTQIGTAKLETWFIA